MATRIKALVEPALLVWARETASLSQEAAAEALDVPVERIKAWEASDGDQPTVSQLKRLAKKYKRPLSVFFLPEPPRGFQPLRDFRRLSDAAARTFTPQLAYEVRAAHERRLVALEVLAAIGERPPTIDVSARVSDDVEAVATRVRKKLGITHAIQCKWGSTDKAFRAWREAMEAAGVLVSVLGGAHHKVPIEEMRGFAIAEQPLPVIVINGQDRGAGRTFTLLHELGHVVLGQSVIENAVEAGDAIPAGDRAIERFCNRMAAAALLPRADILAEPIVAAKEPLRGQWSDEEIAAVARRYGVSREALLVRLLELGRITNAVWQAKRSQYQREREQVVDEAEDSGFAPYRYQVLGYIGRAFTRMVLQGYHSNRLTLSAASGYLGVQAKHVPPLERAAFGLPA